MPLTPEEVNKQLKKLDDWDKWMSTVDSAKIIEENYNDPSNPKKEVKDDKEDDHGSVSFE